MNLIHWLVSFKMHNCKVKSVHKIQHILYMKSINYYLAYYGFVEGRILHWNIDKQLADQLIKDNGLHYHPAKGCDWGHYKRIPFKHR